MSMDAKDDDIENGGG